jgi:hypothetical protein
VRSSPSLSLVTTPVEGRMPTLMVEPLSGGMALLIVEPFQPAAPRILRLRRAHASRPLQVAAARAALPLLAPALCEEEVLGCCR